MLKKLLFWTGLAISLSTNTLLPYAGIEPNFDLDKHTHGEALTNLDRGTDPYRYEDIYDIQISEQNQYEKAQYFMTWLQHEGCQRIFTPEYATHRMSIAHAVLYGKTDPLFLEVACHKQDAKLMQFLLEHKAVDPNASMHSIGFHKPIFSARSVAFIEILQQHGASLQARETLEKTVLHRACHEDYPVEILEYYIQHAGIDINDPSDRDDYKATPLHEWATYSLGTNIVNLKNIECSLKKLDLLLKAGADHKLTDYERKTPLQILQTHLAQYERYQADDLRWPESLRFGNLHTAALKNVIAHFRRATGQDGVQSAL